jgi:cell division protein FtsL
LTCTDKRAVKKFEESLKSFNELLKTYKTEENLATAILFILKKHRKRQTIPVMEGDLRLASRHQAEIGWNNFVLGRWSVKWGEAQQ